MNDLSSRSHSVLILQLEKSRKSLKVLPKNVSETPRAKLISKLYIVDLAGSERVKKSKAEGVTLAEANSINLSLSTLGKCVRGMGVSDSFLPFRDSKLTHALKETFGQTVSLSVLVTISEEPCSGSETISSLQFSTNCKKITNRVFIQSASVKENKYKEVRGE